MRRISITATLLALALAAAPLAAQDRCQITDTFQQCWDRYLPSQQVQEEARETAAEEDERDLEKVDSGVDTAGEGLSSTLKNFLPLLGLTGLVGDTGDTEQDTTFALDLNFLLPGEIRDKNSQLQVVVNTEPKLFEPLKMSLPEETRDEKAAELEGGFSDFDDYSLVFSYNVLNQDFGRTFEAYREEFSILFDTVQGQVIDERRDIPDVLGEVITMIVADVDATDPEGFMQAAAAQIVAERGEPVDLAAVEERAQELMREFEAVALQEAEFDDAITQAFEAAGLRHFAALVNNQPQFFVSLSQSFRNELVGPEQTALKLTWEKPFGPNMNKFRKSLERGCSEDRAACLEGFTTYVKGRDASNGQAAVAGKEAGLKSADRAFFSLEYVDIDDLSINRPEDGLMFQAAGAKKIIASAGWGRTLKVNDKGLPDSRLDFSASYEDVSDDPERTDRILASLTLTKQFGSLTVPIGLVYSNKPEFLAMQDIDQELSARFGLKFNLPGKKKNP